MEDCLKIAGRDFKSRLLVGTGKFSSAEVMRKSVEAAEAEIVTVALRRVDLDNPEDNMLRALDMSKYLVLVNTSGARDAREAARLARLARDGGLETWVKVEVTPDPRTLLPDPIETLKACEILVAEGFTVLPYIPADPILAKRLEEAGAATVMPLGSMIGTGMGIRTRDAVEVIIEQSNVPVVVDAGLGVPSHAAEAMEMGADAVLVNTALAIARDPVAISKAFRMATVAGRMAYLAGPGASSREASASSPLTGFLR